MKVNAAEVAALRQELIEKLAAFKEMADHLVPIISRVIDETGKFNVAIEDRIEQAGKLPGDVLVTIMMHGAMTEILEGLPEGNMRRELLAAGRLIGKFMAGKYRDKITAAIAEQTGGN